MQAEREMDKVRKQLADDDAKLADLKFELDKAKDALRLLRCDRQGTQHHPTVTITVQDDIRGPRQDTASRSVVLPWEYIRGKLDESTPRDAIMGVLEARIALLEADMKAIYERYERHPHHHHHEGGHDHDTGAV